MTKTIEIPEKLAGKIEWIEVPYEIKLSMETSKNRWDTTGVMSRARVRIATGDDIETVYQETYKMLGDLATATAGERMEWMKGQKQEVPSNPMTQATGMLDDTPGKYNAQGDKWCEKHSEWASEKSNDKGTWFSHKSGDAWCNVK